MRYQQREKTLDVFAPCCGAKMTVTYDGTGERWERSSDLPRKCPRGHSLTEQYDGGIVEACDMQDALHAMLDQRARDGVGDRDERDLCGHDEWERRHA